LKQAIITEKGKLRQPMVDRVIGQLRRQLQCVVQQQDKHAEHLM